LAAPEAGAEAAESLIQQLTINLGKSFTASFELLAGGFIMTLNSGKPGPGNLA
jgi:hypothetical protein